LGWARLGAPVSFFMADREADFDADLSGAFRFLLDCEVLSFLFVAMVIPSSASVASRLCRGTVFLNDDNDGVAVRFVRTKCNDELAPPQELQAGWKIVLLPCGSHGFDGRSRSRWRLVSDPGGVPIACLERTCRFDVEHRFVQPVGQLRRRKLREIALVSLIKRDLEVPVAIVHDLDHPLSMTWIIM
jgi:hypothetical protein